MQYSAKSERDMTQVLKIRRYPCPFEGDLTFLKIALKNRRNAALADLILIIGFFA